MSSFRKRIRVLIDDNSTMSYYKGQWMTVHTDTGGPTRCP